MAKRIPGKEEFYETLRYFQHQLEATVTCAGKRVGSDELADGSYDVVVRDVPCD